MKCVSHRKNWEWSLSLVKLGVSYFFLEPWEDWRASIAHLDRMGGDDTPEGYIKKFHSIEVDIYDGIVDISGLF